jgi:hypothetical protein
MATVADLLPLAEVESKMAQVGDNTVLVILVSLHANLTIQDAFAPLRAGQHNPRSSQQQQHCGPLLCHIRQDHDKDDDAGRRRWQKHGEGSSLLVSSSCGSMVCFHACWLLVELRIVPIVEHITARH